MKLKSQLGITYPLNYQHEDKQLTHLFHMNFLSSLEESQSVGGRTGWQPRHLLAEDAERRAARRRALLREDPLARRIRLRPRLGRGLRARRRRLLPQAAGRGAVHAGDRARACWCGPARCADGGARTALADALVEITEASELSSAHVTFLTEAGMARARRARLPAAHRPAIPLGERTATRASTISSPRSSSRKRKTIRRERKEALARRHRGALADRLAI